MSQLVVRAGAAELASFEGTRSATMTRRALNLEGIFPLLVQDGGKQ
ncbi:MAG: hypothetical protein ACI8X5_003270 [Planctomycetota bacterium]|jgi:hypothetical protein